MSSRKPSSFLVIFCIISVLLLSLWTSGMQDLCVQHVLDNGDIVLELDTDSHANDSLEQTALIYRTPASIFVTHEAKYPAEFSPHLVSMGISPPDRPPESV